MCSLLLRLHHFALQELKLIDPSMGSGHILVYAFDVLMQLYEAEGELPRIAAETILKQNLFGLDIDKRAFQLAYFALMMKGRQYSRRILTKGIRPNVYAVPDNAGIGEAELQLLHGNFPDQAKAHQDLLALTSGFQHGHDLGSLISFEGIDFENLKSGLSGGVSFIDEAVHEMVLVGELLQQKYAVGVTNPPYMGSSGFSTVLADFSKRFYSGSKSDMSTMFMERMSKIVLTGGYYAILNIPVWMFISSYEKLRKKMILEETFINMSHNGRGIFGSDFGTTSFIMKKGKSHGYISTFLRLFDNTGEVKSIETKESYFLTRKGISFINQDMFTKIPGSPISYWVSENLIHDFVVGKRMDEIVTPKQGLATADNDRFLRLWWEVDINQIKFDSTSITDSVLSGKKWFPYNKGGAFRRWYGNYDYIVNWENNGEEIRNFVDDKGKLRSRPQNTEYYFKEAITWPLITSGGLSARFRERGSIHDVSGMSAFSSNQDDIYYALGMVNTPIGNNILKVLNPTINSQVGDFQNIPIIVADYDYKSEIISYVKSAIHLVKTDWNTEGDKWDFKRHPLV